MKNILITTIAALGLSLTVAQAADYTVFKVCQDQRILRTSDGADAGHVDYIVVDPGSHQVVSTVITGGVLADRHVAIPISELTFGGEREVTLRQITRERIVSAPVIETTHFSSSYVVQPDIIERSYTHFGVNVNDINRSSTRTTVEGGPDRVGTRATVGDQTTTDRTRAEGRVGTDATRTTTGTNDRTRATADAPDRTRTGAERNGSTSTTDKPAATTDKPGSTNREGARATDPATGKRTGNPDAKTDTTNKDGSAADRSSERAGNKAGAASEKSTDQPGRKSDRSSEKAPLKSESNTEKGPAKPETSTERGSGKPEAGADRPAARTEGSTEKSGTTKRSEKGESKGEASGTRKAGTTEGSATAPAGESKRAQ